MTPKQLWTARILGALAVLFLTFDTVIKLVQLPVAVDGTVNLGYPPDSILIIGVIELICLIAYVVPRTSVVGAVLLTGYLGGAVATHLRIGSPLFSHQLFPVYVGAMVWASLLLRDERLSSLVRGRVSGGGMPADRV